MFSGSKGISYSNFFDGWRWKSKLINEPVLLYIPELSGLCNKFLGVPL
jgi:hypothetical protein